MMEKGALVSSLKPITDCWSEKWEETSFEFADARVMDAR